MSALKWKRVRPGWYETDDNVEGAYVITSDGPGRWNVSQYCRYDWINTDILDLVNVDSSGTLARAKELAEFDNRYNTQSEVSV